MALPPRLEARYPATEFDASTGDYAIRKTGLCGNPQTNAREVAKRQGTVVRLPQVAPKPQTRRPVILLGDRQMGIYRETALFENREFGEAVGCQRICFQEEALPWKVLRTRC